MRASAIRAAIKRSSISSRRLRGWPRHLWRQLAYGRYPRATGVLIFDGTSFPKARRPHQWAWRVNTAARSARLRIARWPSTAALWTGTQAWLLGRPVVFAAGVDDTRGSGRAPKFPRRSAFKKKWRHALTLLRQIRAAGFHVHRRPRAMPSLATIPCCGPRGTARGLPYALGISSTSGGRSSRRRHSTRAAAAARSSRTAPDQTDVLPAGHSPRLELRRVVAAWPADGRGDSITWRNAGRRARGPPASAALRMTPAHDVATHGNARPKCGCSANATVGATPRTKDYLVRSARDRVAPLPRAPRASTMGDRTAVSRTQGQNLASITSKAGRCPAGSGTSCSRPSRIRGRNTNDNAAAHPLADVARRACRDHRDPHRAFLRDASALFRNHAETPRDSAQDLTK